MPNRRCGDEVKKGFWNSINAFFLNGIIKTLLIAVLIGITTFISTSFINMPKDYVPKSEFIALTQTHKEDFVLLDTKKLDRGEYIRANDLLIADTNLKFVTLMRQMDRQETMLTKIYNMHLNHQGK